MKRARVFCRGSDFHRRKWSICSSSTTPPTRGWQARPTCCPESRCTNWFSECPTITSSTPHSRTRPGGSRFSGDDRGAWYGGFSLKTAQAEVAFHYGEGLREVNWQEEETVAYREYLADFRAEFHDLRDGEPHQKYLQPDSYHASQQLGRRLLEHGSAGVVYPSVRHAGGTCIACFRPALVGNVREGTLVTFTFPDAFHAPKVKILR